MNFLRTRLKQGSLLILVFALGFFAHFSLPAVQAFDDNIYRALELFSKVLFYVESDYVDTVDEKGLIEGAIKGMLGTLDPHTLYLTPDIYKDLKADTVGKFGGVGLEVSLKDGILTVVSPIEDTPAQKAGIEPGDRIVKINGEFTKDMNLSDAVKKMRGPRKSKVTLYIYREGWKEGHEYVLHREIIKVKSVKSELIDGKYGYLRITSFQERTAEDLAKAIAELEKSSGGLKGIILDLRSNPGGLLDQAVDVSDLFIKDGLIVSTKGRTHKLEERKASGKAPYPTIPMVVLVNGGSASASEIVAGALQDYGRAYVMGTQSFGKGSVQTIIDLGDGIGLKLTIARYYTPKNRQIDGKGITPDQIVKLQAPETQKAETQKHKTEKEKDKDEEETFTKEDAQKQAAIAQIKKMAGGQ